MFYVDRLLLIGAVLLLVGIASSKFSSRVGLPVLVLFLIVGMLAGEEGIGGIEFENYELAHGIGTMALAVILFDGGLRTSRRAFRAVFGPAISLATFGVLITALVTGLTASWLLGISVLQGLLLGSIIGSTDAAAVFAVLRGRGVNLRKRLAATLEVESGSNDPMAIFLTIGILELLRGELATPGAMLVFLLLQVTVGIVAGVVVGRISVFTINRVNLDAAGLYPILTATMGLFAYALAASLGGSGFLAVYLAGLVIGNRRIVFQKGILHFHDGAAWLAQIAMFVMLGVLVFPSQVLQVAREGLIVALVLIFIARPIAVGLLLPWFGFNLRELTFVAWVGLKGAVPIVLATYPLLFGLEGAFVLFNVVFFAVIVSAVLQGWTLPLFARRLHLQVDAPQPPPVSLEITSLRDVEGDIVEYTVTADARAAGRRIRDLHLPDGAVVAMLVRRGEIVPPRGSTLIEAGDHVFLVLRPGVRPLADRVFRPGRESPPIPASVEFPLAGNITVAELGEFYDLKIDEPPACTLHELFERRAGFVEPGTLLRFSTVDLVARAVEDGYLTTVGLIVRVDGGREEVGDTTGAASPSKELHDRNPGASGEHRPVPPPEPAATARPERHPAEDSMRGG
jgi:potassium/hydrogen antiporter